MFGVSLISLLISSDVTSSNLSNRSTDLGRIVGADASRVDDRIASTLSTTNFANCSAENGPRTTGGGSRRRSSFRYNDLLSGHCSTVLVKSSE